MKVLVLIAVCVGIAVCEHCTETNSCRHTTCDSSSQLHCVNNFCTCTVATSWDCNDVNTCLAINAWNCPQSRRHCIDQRCRCTQV
ncbi:serine protease inhibitor Cvsi-2-like [Ostrea edulis]|uniref:serine protease inhibitor Cvsi-2-like n=1 Tax=Ostrea edulis TaxID=37623 RepID=UPI002095B39B|nr:serine protease inhibitor Cvsi-2-like [Ostrea edulis]